MRRVPLRRFASMLLVLWTFFLLPAQGDVTDAAVKPSASPSPEAAPEQPLPALLLEPALEHFSLGFSRIAYQLRNGRALSTALSVSPGYLPIANPGAANALRKMLSDARIDYLQYGLGEKSEQRLQIRSGEDTLLTLLHSADTARRVWCSPELLPDGAVTTMDVNLFSQSLGQAALGEAIFAAPPDTAAKSAQPTLSLSRLLETAGGTEFVLSQEVADRVLDAGMQYPVYGMLLRPLLSGWKTAAPVVVTRELDDQGEWSSVQLVTQLAIPDASTWDLTMQASRVYGKREYSQKLDVTLSQDKENILYAAYSMVVSELGAGRLRHAVKLTCEGKLNGRSVELRANGSSTNEYAMDGPVLVEQIDGNYTLNWKTRVPALARLGLDEWKITLGTKSVLRTEPPPALASAQATSATASPASFEGKLSLILSRARRDFLSADLTCSAVVQDYAAWEAPAAPLVWEGMDAEEREAWLTDLRARLFRQVAAKLLGSLDEQTLDGMWLQ